MLNSLVELGGRRLVPDAKSTIGLLEASVKAQKSEFEASFTKLEFWLCWIMASLVP